MKFCLRRGGVVWVMMWCMVCDVVLDVFMVLVIVLFVDDDVVVWFVWMLLCDSLLCWLMND